MIDFREELDKFWEKYSWVFILAGALYFAGHIVMYALRRVFDV